MANVLCLLTTCPPPQRMQHAPFQSFSIPVTNEADGKQGVIVFAGDRVGSALLGNTYLARSPGSEVEGGQPIVKSLAKMQSDVALLSPAAAENTGGVRLQESSIRKMRTCLRGMANPPAVASLPSHPRICSWLRCKRCLFSAGVKWG